MTFFVKKGVVDEGNGTFREMKKILVFFNKKTADSFLLTNGFFKQIFEKL